MTKKILLLIFSVPLLLFTGCSSQGTPPSKPYPAPQGIAPYPGPQGATGSGLTPEPPMDAPPPRPGRASISGVLYSYTLPHVLGETMFYLTPAVGEDHRQMPIWLIGPEEQKGDIRGYTNSRGQFALDNIPPGNYYMIVWAPYDWVPAETSEMDNSPLLVELGANQKKPLGIIYLAWQ